MVNYLKVVFDYTKDTLDQFNKSLKTANEATEDLKKNTQEAGKSAESMGDKAASGINQLVTGVKAFLALQVVQEIRGMVNEASKLAAAGEGIANSFKNLGGTTQVIRQLSEAVGGTVSNLKLMQIYISAVQKGIDQSTLVEVLTFAEKQAKATGKSLEGVANTIITGLGKGSAKALATVGLHVESIGKSGDKLKFTKDTLAEIGRVSGELGIATSKAADDTDRLAASQENLQLAIGNLINSTGWTELKAFLATGVQRLADSIDDPFRLALRSDKGIQDLVDNATKELKRLEKAAQDTGFLDFANRGAIKDKTKQQLAILEAAQAELKIRKEAAVKSAAAIAAAEAEALKAAQDADREAAIKARAEADALAYARAIGDATRKAKQLLRAEQLKADREEFVKQKATEGLTDLDRVREINFELESRPGKKTQAIEEAPAELADTTKEIDKNLMSAANSMFAIYDLMTGLAQEESGPKKFLGILSGILGIVGSIPGIGSGFGIAGSILGGIGARLNTGGWVGGLGGNNDSVHALLTPKEFVVNRNAALSSPKLLEAINAGHLNDKLLARVTERAAPMVIVEQDKVVKAIEAMPQIDFYKQGSILFESRISADRRRVQRKARVLL